jgi:hypothetical protein
MQTLQANEITLKDLQISLGLNLTRDPDFFWEWQRGWDPVREEENRALDRICENFSHNLERKQLTEQTVKLVVLSPLLDLAGFYQDPFEMSTEESVTLVIEENGTQIRGRIDILVIVEHLWLMVIESKATSLNPRVGLPQLLSYMLASPDAVNPCFGLITNGQQFQFVKLLKSDTPQYGLSRLFSIDVPAGDFAAVFAILKFLGRTVLSESNH